MILLCDLDNDGICRRCGRQVKCFAGRRTLRPCFAPPGPAEIARRKALCLACSFWDGTGCKLVQEFERERLTAYRWTHGHCARCSRNGGPKW